MQAPNVGRYLPHVILATLFVGVLPIVVVWELREHGQLQHLWQCLGLAIVLTLAAASLGSAFWKRRPHSVDMTFAELMVWGWLRRWRLERRLANATKELGLAGAGAVNAEAIGGAGSGAERSAELLVNLATAFERLDAYTAGHSNRTARRAVDVAQRMKLSDEQIATIQAAATLHDVGKLLVPREILNKPGRLTDAEFEVVKRHSITVRRWSRAWETPRSPRSCATITNASREWFSPRLPPRDPRRRPDRGRR